MSTVYCIIPVYNRHKVARECVKLLLRQSYEKLQVIIVDHSDDGSDAKLAHLAGRNVTILRGLPTF